MTTERVAPEPYAWSQRGDGAWILFKDGQIVHDFDEIVAVKQWTPGFPEYQEIPSDAD